MIAPRDLAKLIDDHAGPLRLCAVQWCHTPDDAVQDGFCKLAAQRTVPLDPVAWLYTVVRRRAQDLGKSERRRYRREVEHAQTIGWFQQPDTEGLDAQTAIDSLQKLEPDTREIIIARLWGNLTFEQIATAYGHSISTTFRHYEAGILQLRTLLKVHPND